MSTGPGGGLSTGSGDHYVRNWPPIPVLVKFMDQYGMGSTARMLRTGHGISD